MTLRNLVQNVLEIAMFIYNKKKQIDNERVNNGGLEQYEQEQTCRAKGVAFQSQFSYNEEPQTLLAVIRPLDIKHPGHNLCRI